MALADIFNTHRFTARRPFSLNVKKRLALWKSRRALARLDERALKDIGVSPQDAQREARLSVWDVPTNWID